MGGDDHLMTGGNCPPRINWWWLIMGKGFEGKRRGGGTTSIGELLATYHFVFSLAWAVLYLHQ